MTEQLRPKSVFLLLQVCCFWHTQRSSFYLNWVKFIKPVLWTLASALLLSCVPTEFHEIVTKWKKKHQWLSKFFFFFLNSKILSSNRIIPRSLFYKRDLKAFTFGWSRGEGKLMLAGSCRHVHTRIHTHTKPLMVVWSSSPLTHRRDYGQKLPFVTLAQLSGRKSID